MKENKVEKLMTLGEALEELKIKSPETLNSTRFIFIAVNEDDEASAGISGKGKDLTSMFGYVASEMLEQSVELGETEEEKRGLLKTHVRMLKSAIDAAEAMTQLKMTKDNPIDGLIDLLGKLKTKMEKAQAKAKDETPEGEMVQ